MKTLFKILALLPALSFGQLVPPPSGMLPVDLDTVSGADTALIGVQIPGYLNGQSVKMRRMTLSELSKAIGGSSAAISDSITATVPVTFFRQLDSISVTISGTDTVVVPFDAVSIPWSWWAVGKRLVFEVPAAGTAYSDIEFGVAFKDNAADTSFAAANYIAQAGSEVQSFRVVCDVAALSGGPSVTLNCWVDYPASGGFGAAQIFSTVTFGTSSLPVLVQVYISQSDVWESVVKFKNAQFTAMPISGALR